MRARGDRQDDLYERLGVARDADAREIRRRYLEQVARYHPDHHPGNPLGDLARERVAELNAAYEVLSDPSRRAAYDGRRNSPAGGGDARQTPTARRPTAGGINLRRGWVRGVVTIVVLAVSALAGLRLAPTVGRLAADVFGTAAGQILAVVLLVAVGVVVIVRSRARRPK